jgi:N-acetylmuramoyl-L-alanine amidase
MNTGCVIINSGHGQNTEGKRSPLWEDGTQLFEWEFNRSVSKLIYDRLTTLSIPCTILVPEARDISLRTRVNRANAIYRQYPGSFLISVHGNAGGGQGWEVWTSPGETESDLLASLLYTQSKIWLAKFKHRSDYTDGDPDKEARFYILQNTLCPAVLTENLFYDNYDECSFMLSSYGRELIAKLHIYAIREYLDLKSR